MAFSENVRDALMRVHSATRALQIARDVRERERLACHIPAHGFLIDDVVTALVRQLQDAESSLVARMEAEGERGTVTDPINGHTLTVRINDRRSVPRPMFVLHRAADAPAGRRRVAALVPA